MGHLNSRAWDLGGNLAVGLALSLGVRLKPRSRSTPIGHGGRSVLDKPALRVLSFWGFPAA